MEPWLHFFPYLNEKQASQLDELEGLYSFWNEKINLISRKDMEHFRVRHLLHSLSVAMFFRFNPGTSILDVGTGGGFPGIPLAIIFPEVSFTLADSVAKKIKVVEEVKRSLELSNVETALTRVEQMHSSYDYVVSRAVTRLPDFVKLAGNRVSGKGFNRKPNGILYLKGGDFHEELKEIKGWSCQLFNLEEKLEDLFFETKKLVFLHR
jgi:16S rRNA (guanine527-N7)-methyltransferase